MFMPDMSVLPCGGMNSLVMKLGTKLPMITDGDVDCSYELEPYRYVPSSGAGVCEGSSPTE